jgi:hypothetical protein
LSAPAHQPLSTVLSPNTSSAVNVVAEAGPIASNAKPTDAKKQRVPASMLISEPRATPVLIAQIKYPNNHTINLGVKMIVMFPDVSEGLPQRCRASPTLP